MSRRRTRMFQTTSKRTLRTAGVAVGLRFEDQLEPDLPEIEREFKAEVAKQTGSR
jgi:hypothetical protein